MESQSYYVYHHVNPLTGKIFYVGKGTGLRAYAARGRTVEWSAVVSALMAKGSNYSIVIAHSGLTNEEALRIEGEDIRRLSVDNPLVNKQQASCVTECTTDGWDQTEELRAFAITKRKESGILRSSMASLLGMRATNYHRLESKENGVTIKTLSHWLYVLGYKLKIVPID